MGFFREEVSYSVDEDTSLIVLPDGVDHFEDVVSGQGVESFDCEEEVGAGRVEFGDTESDGCRGPDSSLEEEIALRLSEIIDKEGVGGLVGLLGRLASCRGGDAGYAGLGDF